MCTAKYSWMMSELEIRACALARFRLRPDSFFSLVESNCTLIAVTRIKAEFLFFPFMLLYSIVVVFLFIYAMPIEAQPYAHSNHQRTSALAGSRLAVDGDGDDDDRPSIGIFMPCKASIYASRGDSISNRHAFRISPTRRTNCIFTAMVNT